MDNNYTQALSENLSYLMQIKEINNLALGNMMGIASSSIGEWLSQEFLPSFKNLIRLTEIFHTSIDYLFGMADQQYFFHEYDINFYDTIIAILKKNKITKKKLAAKCGFTPSQFDKWKRGSMPRTDILLNIAIYLDLPVEYIIGRTDKTAL